PGDGLIHLISVGATQHGFAVMPYIPGKPYSRLEVLVVLLVRLAHRLNYAPSSGGRHHSGKPVQRLRRSHVPGVTHAQFERQVRLQLPAIHGKEIQAVLIDAVGHVAQRPGSGKHSGRLEAVVVGDRRIQRVLEHECSRVVVEVVIAKVAEFAAKLEGMPAVHPAERVAPYEGRVATALREVAFASDGKGTLVLNSDDRQELQVRAQSAAQAQRIRVNQIVRSERDMDSVGSNTSFIDHIRSEDVRLAQRQHLAFPLTGVTPAGKNRAAGGAGLLAQVMLIDVVAVQAVHIADLVVNIRGTLVNIYGRSC